MLPKILLEVGLTKGVGKLMDFDVADIKPNVVNALMILLVVVITVPLAKWALNRYPVPGLTTLVNAV